MKKAFTAILIAAACIAAIAIAAVASVPLWLPEAKLKAMLVERVEEMTGRGAQVDGLKFNILRGIELTGVRLKEGKRYGDRDFIRDDRIVLGYNLFALFAGKLVITRFELIAPYAEIVKEQSGRYNFTDIFERASSVKKPVPGKKAASKKGFIRDIIVTSVTVRDGVFAYADYSGKRPVSARIKDFNLHLEDLILSAAKPVGLYASCSASYDNFTVPVALRSKVRVDLPKKQAVLTIESFNITGLSSKGEVKLSDFKDVSGRISSTADIKKILEILPEEAAQKFKEVDASIPLANELRFTYAAKKFRFTDTLAFSGGEAAYKGKKVLQGLTGTVKVDDTFAMKGNISMLLAGSRVDIKAQGERVNSAKEGVIKVDIYSPKFASEYLVAMFPKKSTAAAKTADAPAKQAAAAKKQAKSPGVYVNLEADKVTFKEIEFGRTTSVIKFTGGKLYADTQVKGYGGTMTNYIEADINSEKYATDVAVSNVKVNGLISDAIAVMPRKAGDKDKKTLLDDMKDKVYGTLTMKGSFSGDTFKNVAETIKGSGEFRVGNGYLKSLETGRDLSKKIGAAFLEKDIPFDEMYGDFTMASGKISVKEFVMQNGPGGASGDMKVKGAGWMTVDSRLDIKLNIDFSPKVAKQVEQGIAGIGVKDASYAYNADGWMPFDLRIYNTIREKKYDYTQKRLLDNIKKNLGKKLNEEAGKYLEKNAGELIKGLFKNDK